jgi:hypothetical protein
MLVIDTPTIVIIAAREQCSGTPPPSTSSSHVAFLVHEEGLHLVALLAQLLVAAHEQDLREPREQERSDGERRRRRERNDVARGVGLGPEVGCPIVCVLVLANLGFARRKRGGFLRTR